MGKPNNSGDEPKYQKSMDIIDANSGLKESSSAVFGALLFTLTSAALGAVLGLEIEGVIGSIILGIGIGQAIVKKVLPKIIKKVTKVTGEEITKTLSEEGTELKASSDLYNISSGLATSLNSTMKNVLIITGIIFIAAHVLAPLIPKLITLLPQIAPVLETIALFIPGLQIAIIAIYATITLYSIGKKINNYRKEKAAEREFRNSVSAPIHSNLDIDKNRLQLSASKETLCGITGTILCNALLITAQVGIFTFGAKAAMPVAGILLLSFVAAYTMFYTLPNGIYNIAISFKKIDISKMKPLERNEKTSDMEDKIDKSAKKGFQHKLALKTKKFHKAITLAVIGSSANYIIKELFKMPAMQHIAVIGLGFVATSAVILIAIPRIVNNRRMKNFKDSRVYKLVKEELQHDHSNTFSLDNVDLISAQQSLAESNSATREKYIEQAYALFQTRPDIVIATIIVSLSEQKDETGKNRGVKFEKSIIKNGFADLDLKIHNLDNNILRKISSMKENSVVTNSSLAGPYINNREKPSITLLRETPTKAKTTIPQKQERPIEDAPDERPNISMGA